MLWIEFHTSLRDHWKIKRLADEIGVEYNEALGAMSCLWLWAAEYAKNGDLSRFKDAELRHAAHTSRDKFCAQVLIACELIDGKKKINDWREYGIKHLESSRLRTKKYRERLRNGDVTVTSTLPYPTRPNHTLPHRTKEEIVVPDDLKPNEPEIRDWLQYKKERGEKYASKTGLGRLWASFRAIPENKRRESVDHSMANNWAGLFEKKTHVTNRVVGAASVVPGKYDHLS